MMYADKKDPRVLFCDNRRESLDLCDGRHYTVDPDVCCDFVALPFRDDEFDVVVFDPPHLQNVGVKSWLALKYGKLLPGWEETISEGFAECFRVLRPSGLLIFKWSEQQVPLSKILKLTPVVPLIKTNKSKHDKTHFVIFYKEQS